VLALNAIQVAPLEDFSLEVMYTTRHAQAKMNLITLQAVRANFQEAQKVLSGNGSEEDKAEACIKADYESLQHASMRVSALVRVGVQVQVRACGLAQVQV
jgi:F-type H+-transporting ATPase subunit delta